MNIILYKKAPDIMSDVFNIMSHVGLGSNLIPEDLWVNNQIINTIN